MTAGVQPLDWRNPPTIQLPPILAASLDLFHDQGFHGTSVRDIATRVGVTVPALYYHYENKESILFALLKGSIDQLVELTEAASAAPITNVGERFLHVMEAIIRWELDNREVAFLDGEARLLGDASRSLYVAQRDRVEAAVLNALCEGIEDGALSSFNPRYTARAILGMVQAIPTWYRPDGRADVDDVVARYLHMSVLLADASDVIRAQTARGFEGESSIQGADSKCAPSEH